MNTITVLSSERGIDNVQETEETQGNGKDYSEKEGNKSLGFIGKWTCTDHQ